ncbi:hypothetical protein [Mycolicibacterium sp. 624]|uniref:hypothetical protein n=1 Tax=Mycolicibacterium sp. 624 TaxID=3156314 RepID=UPI0033907D47
MNFGASMVAPSGSTSLAAGGNLGSALPGAAEAGSLLGQSDVSSPSCPLVGSFGLNDFSLVSYATPWRADTSTTTPDR